MLVYFSGVITDPKRCCLQPAPEAEFKFWTEMKTWLEENPASTALKVFRPTFIQAVSSLPTAGKIRAYLRDHDVLGGSLVITSLSLNSMLMDWVAESDLKGVLRKMKTVNIWAEIMYNFARILMLDVYALPQSMMDIWEMFDGMQANPLIELGQFVLETRLNEDPDRADHDDPSVLNVVAHEAGDRDEMLGPCTAQSSRPDASARELAEMELSSDTNRWIIGEALSATTCKPQGTKTLTVGFRCSDRRKCPRCAAQYQI